MTEPTITASHVLAHAKTNRPRAEKIAEYGNLRAAGARIADAARGIGIVRETATDYEKWVAAIRTSLHLPPLPKGDAVRRPTLERSRQAGVSGAHSLHHTHGSPAADCELCP